MAQIVSTYECAQKLAFYHTMHSAIINIVHSLHLYL